MHRSSPVTTSLLLAAFAMALAGPAFAGGTVHILYDDIDNSYHPRSTSKNCVKSGNVYEDELCVSSSSGSDGHEGGDDHESGDGSESGDSHSESGDGHSESSGDGHGESESESEGHH
jgi:hypothetical protein